MQITETMDGSTALGRTGLLVGEALVPGASNLVAGNIGAGLGTLVGTSLAVAVLAPVSPLLAAFTAIGLRLNSYKLATTGASLLTDAEAMLPKKPAPSGGTVIAPAKPVTPKQS